MRIAVVVLSVAVLAQSSSGVFEIELWPGEGRPRFRAATAELGIREAPSVSAKVVRRLPVSKGQEITFDQTRYRTVKAGRLQVLTSTSVNGRILGAIRFLSLESYYKGRFPTKAVECRQGDALEYLQYRAEGTCFVRIGGQVIDADPCPVQDERAFRVATKPETEWWIRMVLNDTPVGWLRVEDASIKLIDRQF